MKKITFLSIFLIFILSCNQKHSKNNLSEDDTNKNIVVDTINNIVNNTINDTLEVKEQTFFEKYSIIKPSDLNSNFEKIKIINSILTPIPPLAKENETDKKAYNLGVFCADFIFCFNAKKYKLASEYYSASSDYAINLGLNDFFSIENYNFLNREDTINIEKIDYLKIIDNLFLKVAKSNQNDVLPFLLQGFYFESINLYFSFSNEIGTDNSIFTSLITNASNFKNYLNEVLMSMNDFELSSKIQTIIDDNEEILNSFPKNTKTIDKEKVEKIRDVLIRFRKDASKTIDEKIQLRLQRKINQ